MKHTIGVAEIRKIMVEQVLASDNARRALLFRYDIGRRRLWYVVRYYSADAEPRERYYDTLIDAIRQYNEVEVPV